MNLLQGIFAATGRVTLLPHWDFAPQFVEEVQEHHDFVFLLGRCSGFGGGFHGCHHRQALAVGRQIPLG
jgi:hypothetical protein